MQCFLSYITVLMENSVILLEFGHFSTARLEISINGHNLLFDTGVYCCGVFCLIGISIVETILVNYVQAKGAKRRSVETASTISGPDGKTGHCI